jgi:hypothetical protein
MPRLKKSDPEKTPAEANCPYGLRTLPAGFLCVRRIPLRISRNSQPYESARKQNRCFFGEDPENSEQAPCPGTEDQDRIGLQLKKSICFYGRIHQRTICGRSFIAFMSGTFAALRTVMFSLMPFFALSKHLFFRLSQTLRKTSPAFAGLAVSGNFCASAVRPV